MIPSRTLVSSYLHYLSFFAFALSAVYEGTQTTLLFGSKIQIALFFEINVYFDILYRPNTILAPCIYYYQENKVLRKVVTHKEI